jgi:hypothetical protein
MARRVSRSAHTRHPRVPNRAAASTSRAAHGSRVAGKSASNAGRPTADAAGPGCMSGCGSTSPATTKRFVNTTRTATAVTAVPPRCPAMATAPLRGTVSPRPRDTGIIRLRDTGTDRPVAEKGAPRSRRGAPGTARLALLFPLRSAVLSFGGAFSGVNVEHGTSNSELRREDRLRVSCSHSFLSVHF